MKYMHMIHCWFSLNVELGAVGSIRTYARPPGGMVLTQYRTIVYVLTGHSND